MRPAVAWYQRLAPLTLARSPLTRYGIAVAAAGLAVLLRVALQPVWGLELPFITFFPAMMVSAWLGGFGPGIVTTLLCAGAAAYFWLPPVPSLTVSHVGDLVALLVFVGIGGVISGLNEAWRRMAGAVAESEKRLAVTLGSIGDAVIATDGQGRVTLLNEVAQALTGWTDAEAAGRPLGDVFVIVNEDSRRPVESPVGKVLREGLITGLANHTVLLSKDGREIPIDDSAAPIQAADGSLLGVVMVFRDITERRQTERERAALFQKERAARTEVERVAERLRRLQAVTDTTLVNLGFQDLVHALLARVRLALGSDTATILLLEPDGQELVPVASDGLGEELDEGIRIPVGRGVAGRIAASEHGLVIDDLTTGEVVSPRLSEKVKSLVGAPLRIEDRLIGVIHAGAASPRQFAETDLDLMRLVAERAALVVERARLHEAERAARAEADRQRREAEVIAELARAINASLDLGTILVRVTDSARELLGTDLAALALRDPATGTIIVRYQAGSRLRPDEPIRVQPGRGVGGHVLISGDPFRSADVLSDPRLSLRHPEYFLAEGIVAMLVVPMRIDDRIEGLLYASHRSHHLFTDRDEAMLSRLADHVAVAVRNRQLLAAEHAARTAAEGAERRASFLAGASQLLAASLDYETTLASLARLAVPEICDLCVINIRDDDGAIRRAAAVHVDPDKEELLRELRQRFPIDPNGPHPVARVLRTGEPDIAPDVSDAAMATIAWDPEHRKIGETLGYRSYIVVPLIARGRVLGAMSFVSGPSGRRYGPPDLARCEDFAHRAALAVDNATLYRRSEAARAETEEAEQRLRLALEAGAMGTWEWLVVAGEVRWSPGLEAIHGYTPGTFPGTFEAFQREIHPEDRDRVLQAIADAVEQRREHRVEYRIVRVDGAVRWVEGRGRLFCDAGGRPERMVGVCADVTERRRAEEGRAQLLVREQAARQEAEAANRAKDQFLAVLSHELRTPLTTMLGWVRVLRTARLEPSQVERALETIERNTRAQARMIDDLLDVSRIAAGKMTLDRRSMNLGPVVAETVQSLQHEAKAREVTLQTHVDPTAGAVLADADRIRQILGNLLVNAMKYTPSGGRVEVRLTAEDGAARIEVKDTGSGIERDLLPYVFERFRQADWRTAGTQGGLGLGLAIVRELVDMHGGTVEAQSDGPGRGAAFIVTLPMI